MSHPDDPKVEVLRAALATAIFRTTITRLWKDATCGNDDYLLDFTDEVKEWAVLAGVDISTMDPSAYHRP